jgi:hypothetical protein
LTDIEQVLVIEVGLRQAAFEPDSQPLDFQAFMVAASRCLYGSYELLGSFLPSSFARLALWRLSRLPTEDSAF